MIISLLRPHGQEAFWKINKILASFGVSICEENCNLAHFTLFAAEKHLFCTEESYLCARVSLARFSSGNYM